MIGAYRRWGACPPLKGRPCPAADAGSPWAFLHSDPNLYVHPSKYSCLAGGSLQPYFAQRNMEVEAAMSSQSYRAPAAEGRTDSELALSVAALEHQQQERQRRLSQERLAETDADAARRFAYQQAQQPYAQQQQVNQHMPPLPGSVPVAYGMSGVAPSTSQSPSVPNRPYQTQSDRQHSQYSERDDSGPYEPRYMRRQSQSLAPNQIRQGVEQQRQRAPQHMTRRRDSNETRFIDFEQRNSRAMPLAAGSQPRQQRSVSYDAAVQPAHGHAHAQPVLGSAEGGAHLSQTAAPSSFLKTHQQMLDAHRRAATCDGLPHTIRVTADAIAHECETSDAVAHVLAGLPPPASPLAGTALRLATLLHISSPATAILSRNALFLSFCL